MSELNQNLFSLTPFQLYGKPHGSSIAHISWLLEAQESTTSRHSTSIWFSFQSFLFFSHIFSRGTPDSAQTPQSLNLHMLKGAATKVSVLERLFPGQGVGSMPKFFIAKQRSQAWCSTLHTVLSESPRPYFLYSIVCTLLWPWFYSHIWCGALVLCCSNHFQSTVSLSKAMSETCLTMTYFC